MFKKHAKNTTKSVVSITADASTSGGLDMDAHFGFDQTGDFGPDDLISAAALVLSDAMRQNRGVFIMMMEAMARFLSKEDVEARKSELVEILLHGGFDDVSSSSPAAGGESSVPEFIYHVPKDGIKS